VPAHPDEPPMRLIVVILLALDALGPSHCQVLQSCSTVCRTVRASPRNCWGGQASFMHHDVTWQDAPRTAILETSAPPVALERSVLPTVRGPAALADWQPSGAPGREALPGPVRQAARSKRGRTGGQARCAYIPSRPRRRRRRRLDPIETNSAVCDSKSRDSNLGDRVTRCAVPVLAELASIVKCVELGRLARRVWRNGPRRSVPCFGGLSRF
jgi:hypothetical protein